MILRQDIRILIPARSGSVSVKHKNIKIIEGHPLIAYTIGLARKLLPADKVWVTTDSEHYREISIAYGASVPFLRPPHLSQALTTDFEVFEHAISKEKELFGNTVPYWLHLRPTSPLRSAKVVMSALNSFIKHDGATSLRSVHSSDKPVLKWMMIDDEGFARTLSGDSNIDSLNFPRQNYPESFVPNGYVDIIRSSSIRRGFMHGRRTLAFKTEYVPDLDTEDDFQKLSDLPPSSLSHLIVTNE